MVLATVKGDVHDIGKNLVDIILTNNGYTVHNLGIKIAIGEMIEKAREVKADAIGMTSGLLVKSTLIMRENLEELNSRGLAEEVHVLLGGAALTRNYVEVDLRSVYDGRVFYGKDAFEGLRTMDTLMAGKKSGSLDSFRARSGWAPATAPQERARRRRPARRSAGSFRRRLGRGEDLRAAVRGRGSPRAFRSTTSPVHQRDRALPKPVAVPARQDQDRERRRVQGAHPSGAARTARHRAQGVVARSRRRVGLLRGERGGQRSRGVGGRSSHPGVDAFRLSPPAEVTVPVHRGLLPFRGDGRR